MLFKFKFDVNMLNNCSNISHLMNAHLIVIMSEFFFVYRLGNGSTKEP